MYVEVSSFINDYLEAASFEDEMCTTLRVKLSGSGFSRNYQRTKDAEADKNLFK